jgi:uncharacterized protein YegP (UPF0339 family)
MSTLHKPRKEARVAYYIYKDNQNLWRWRLRAANNRTIADSGESYYNKQDCLAAINLVKSSGNAPVYEI